MQICKEHWNKIRARIKELGIDHLGAQNAEAALEQMQDQIEGNDDPKNFDPLMSCNWMICHKALELGGLQLMCAKEDGSSSCPICEAWIHRHDGYDPGDPEVTLELFENFWIIGPTGAALLHCQTLGLVPRQQ